jgi:hypothetical protein
MIFGQRISTVLFFSFFRKNWDVRVWSWRISRTYGFHVRAVLCIMFAVSTVPVKLMIDNELGRSFIFWQDKPQDLGFLLGPRSARWDEYMDQADLNHTALQDPGVGLPPVFF